jgi:hypothetical protein
MTNQTQKTTASTPSDQASQSIRGAITDTVWDLEGWKIQFSKLTIAKNFPSSGIHHSMSIKLN